MTFKVVCTGRGIHKRRHFNEINVTGDEMRVRPVRIKNMPELKGGTIEGVTVEHKAVMPPSYEPKIGDDSWRWDCDLCRADERFTDDGLRSWLDSVAESGRRTADISKRRV